MSTNVVIADAHTFPLDDFSRFDWLGRLLVDVKPDYLTSIGDFSNMDSMSAWEDIKPHSFAEDAAAMKEAQRRMFAPLEEFNERRRRSKRAPLRIVKTKIKGNHEERADRQRKKDPNGWASAVDFDDYVGYNEYWDAVHEFGETVNISGVDYTHCLKGNTGRALALGTVAKHTYGHLIQGHQHSLQYLTVPVPGGVRMVMSAPAFMQDGYVPGYAKQSTRGWTYGLLIVREEGEREAPNVEYISMKELERRYT